MPDPKPHHRRAAADPEAPDVCFHIERDGKFYAYDRHSVVDAPFWVAFGEPFMCQWQSANDAISAYEPGDVIRVSIDGTLYSAQAIADAEERRDVAWRDKIAALDQSLRESLSDCDYNDERMSAYQRHHRMLVNLKTDAERAALSSPNRIEIALPECVVTGRKEKFLAVDTGDPLFWNGMEQSEGVALKPVASGTRFRPTLVLEPVPARAALEGKP